jgi:hypothetical protein
MDYERYLGSGGSDVIREDTGDGFGVSECDCGWLVMKKRLKRKRKERGRIHGKIKDA